MGKKLLIDLQKLREFKGIPVEGLYKRDEYTASFKTIRELATFQYTCRRCEKAPCVEACPAEALKKGRDEIVRRSLLRCVRCKSCIVICPFGTLMDDLFAVKTAERVFISLSGEQNMQRFAESFPDGVASMTDLAENPDQYIFSLTDDILIKEFTWH